MPYPFKLTEQRKSNYSGEMTTCGSTKEYVVGGVIGAVTMLMVVFVVATVLCGLGILRIGKPVDLRRGTRAGKKRRHAPIAEAAASNHSDIPQGHVNHAFEDDAPSANTTNKNEHTYVNYGPYENLRPTEREPESTSAEMANTVDETQENHIQCPYVNVRLEAPTPVFQRESEEVQPPCPYRNAGNMRVSAASQGPTAGLQRGEHEDAYDDTKVEPAELGDDNKDAYDDTKAEPAVQDAERNGLQISVTSYVNVELDRGGNIGEIGSDARPSANTQAYLGADESPTGRRTEGQDPLYAHLMPVKRSEYEDLQLPNRNPRAD